MSFPEEAEVLIIGNGFAGMNLGRILADHEINCTIISNGYGASNLWAGSFDFLKTLPENPEIFEKDLLKFVAENPDHPYSHIPLPMIKMALDDFFEAFSHFYVFKNHIDYYNGSVLTLLGQVKPCLGLWETIFHDFDSLSDKSACYLVEFQEFNNSAMNLVCRGLQERYPGKFSVITISLAEIFQKTDSDMLKKLNSNRLTVNNIAKFFETDAKATEHLGDLLKTEVDNLNLPSTPHSAPQYLFSPVLGIENSVTILKTLSEIVGGGCYELVSLSPSVMATRLLNKMTDRIKKSFCSLFKGYTMIGVSYLGGEKGFRCTFRNRKGIEASVVTQKLVVATGSVFLSGLSADVPALLKLVKEDPKKLHFCGSACYLTAENISDEDEIRFGTGLGLAVVTSYHIGQKIIGGPQL